METAEGGEQQLARNTAANLKRLREEHGLTLDQACQRLGELGLPMKKPTLSKVENGDRKVMLSEAFVFARLYRVGVETLLQAPDVGLTNKAQELVEAMVDAFGKLSDAEAESEMAAFRLREYQARRKGAWEDYSRAESALASYMHRHPALVDNALEAIRGRIPGSHAERLQALAGEQEAQRS